MNFVKFNITKSRLWLCLPIIAADILDGTETLLGQPSEYWNGSHNLVNEFNPMAHWFMTTHPAALFIYVVPDFLTVSILIMVVPLTLAKTLSVFWTISGAIGLYNWLAGPLHMGWWISNIVTLIPAIILVYALDKASVEKVHVNSQ